ncbi:hypothetical protein GMOD_00009638 [Pyrenophora seminiperda CCB06]|uniref:N-acetyltransferase domain-containing protein n=1 Tax=Pyrenophora seminiperda CCB06 TaxID=1302712 RepID=A0A3M7MF37_9PLEO|nr:hypothetical protein GMOD_00009638 [Pyrenophora seminiperda CCB06]
MTSVLKGGFGSPTGAPSLNTNPGTEFVNTVCPLKGALDGYDNRLPCSKQSISVPQNFADAMTVREEVYGEQGVPLEVEFDEDDARSWHWIAYASVATHTTSPPKTLRRSDSGNTPADDVRRASATATRVPVATIRLIPPPHGTNKYLEEHHHTPSADAPSSPQEAPHPSEPYIKLGRLAVRTPYRNLGLAKLLINAALDYATSHADLIYRPPSPTALETAQMLGINKEKEITWQGLVMVHAQAHLHSMWEKHGFHEELRSADDGKVEIPAEPHWMEEGIEHVGMWKRLEVDRRKRLSLSSLDDF